MAAAAGDLQVLQGFDRHALGLFSAGDDVDQVDVVVHLRHRRAADHAVHHVGHVFELTPSWRALSWAMSMRSTLPGSFQS